MKAAQISFYEWMQKFSTDQRCMDYLETTRWPNGFQCPHCGHDGSYFTAGRGQHECISCHQQTSVTAGTLFHATKLPLTKWFWAIYWVATDKGGISALRLSKLVGIRWKSAYLLLKKLRTGMGNRDAVYRLSEIVELDDALVGGKRSGKRGRGAEGKVSVLVACENRNGKPGFLAMEAIEAVNKENIRDFAERRIKVAQTVHTDGLPANNGLQTHVTHIAKVTPPEMANEWLPWVR